MSDATAVWYVGLEGQQQGPWTLEQVLERITAGEVTEAAYVYSSALGDWTPITKVAAFSGALRGAAEPPPPPPPSGPAPSSEVDEIDYEVLGQEMQYVEITLDPDEAAVAEAGAFMYMDPGIEMQTVFGDGGQQQGGFWDKLVGAGKRLLVGESLFMTVFSNRDRAGRRIVAFAAPYPGKIIPMDLRQHNGVMICQKDAFLCAAKGISVGIAFQKKLGTGLFGGEGFILQKLEGQGLAFVHAGGSIAARELGAGETLRVDTGCIVAMEQQVGYDIQFVGSVKSAFFGGEGLFFATLTGPGKVWLQSLPFSRLADRVYAAAPKLGGKDAGEGSILGGLGLGD